MGFSGLHNPQNKAEVEGSVGLLTLLVPNVHLTDGLPASRTGPALTERVWLAFLSCWRVGSPRLKSGRCSTQIEVDGDRSDQAEE